MSYIKVYWVFKAKTNTRSLHGADYTPASSSQPFYANFMAPHVFVLCSIKRLFAIHSSIPFHFDQVLLCYGGGEEDTQSQQLLLL